MTTLEVPDPAERGDLGAFVARVVRLDQAATVRLRDAGGRVTAWASTPFDVLVTRSVHGTLEPADVAVASAELLTALAVERAARVDLGAGGPWRGELPPEDGWAAVDEVPAVELESIAERGLALARENVGPLGPPSALLDQTVLTVTAPSGHSVPSGSSVPSRSSVKVPLRCLLALSGMGFLGDLSEDGVVRVSATGSWLRLDARYGAAVRRRTVSLPLRPA